MLRNKFYEKFSLLLILGYLLVLSLIGILPEATIFTLDIVFNVVFTIEIALKFIGFGFRRKKL